MDQIVNLLVNNGVAVVVVLYYLYKDYTLTKQTNQVISQNTEVLGYVKSMLESFVGKKINDIKEN